MQTELIKRLLENEDFKIFLEHAGSKIDELNSVSGLQDLSNDRAGEEAKVRNLAVKKVTQILSPFLQFKEKAQVSEKELEAAKKRVGL